MPNPNAGHLEFYPGVHVMIWVVDGHPSLWVQAWGGSDPVPGWDDGGMKPRKTTPGRYLIYSRGAYVTHTWELSRIAWGTPLRVDRTRTPPVVLYATGMVHPAWRPVRDRVPTITTDYIQHRYMELYGETGLFDADADRIPDRWVFNDFGPWAVRYYRDTNHDGRLDGKEALSGEMIHTTPDDEADNARGIRVSLGSSHGCIHVSPRGRQKLLAVGAFERGTELIIHPYTRSLPAGWRP